MSGLFAQTDKGMISCRLRNISQVLHRTGPLTLVLLTLTLAWGLPAGAQEQDPTHRTTDITLGEAVLLALKHNTNIKLAKQDVDISKGELDQVSGEFDFVINSSLSQEHTYDPLAQVDRLAYDRTFETTNITSFKLGVQKLLRSGITLEPNITVSRSRNTLDYPELPASQAKVAFAVIVPLMRGLGEEATGATERAAKLQLEGTRFDYYHSAAQNIFATVADYWQLREFQKAVEVYADSEKRAKKLLDESIELVKGEQLPRSELTNLRANLDLKAAQRLAATTSLNSAREVLANNLGLAAYGQNTTPVASQKFPDKADISALGQTSLEQYNKMALAKRADLKASKLKEKSAREILIASLDKLKPKVDLTLSAGYSGLSEEEAYRSYYDSFGDGVYGLNAIGSVDFELPPALTSARGEVISSRASLRKAKLVVSDTLRRIKLGVASAYSELLSSAQQVGMARKAVQNYQQAVQDERMKLKLGTSTILNVIQVEDNLTTALLNDVNAKQSFATAVVRLRFETGTLITGDPTEIRLNLDDIGTIPRGESGP